MKSLILLALLAGLAYANPTQILASAVTIHYYEGGELKPTCSGANVALAHGNRIVTAGHCVWRNRRYYAKDVNDHVYALKLEQENRHEHDFAIFASSAAYLLPALPLARERAKVGDPVYMAAGPQGFNLQFYRGYVTGYAHPHGELAEHWRGALIVDIGAAPGSSGSIITNEQGEALSIISGTREVAGRYPFLADMFFPGFFTVPIPLGRMVTSGW